MTQEMMGNVLVAKQPEMLSMAIKLCGDIVKAKDLVQDTCLRALEKCEQFLTGEIMPWLKQVMSSILFDRWRKADVRAKHIHEIQIDCIDRDKLDEVFDTSVDVYSQDELKVQTSCIMARLSERDRKVLVMVAHGYSSKQVAEALGVGLNTALSIVSRARKKAQKLMVA